MIPVQELEKVVMPDPEAVTPIQEGVAGCQFVTRLQGRYPRKQVKYRYTVDCNIGDFRETSGCQQTFAISRLLGRYLRKHALLTVVLDKKKLVS